MSRRWAATLDIPVRGTLGVLLLAKKKEIIEQLEPVLDEVVTAGLRVHPNIRGDLLRLSGERRPIKSRRSPPSPRA